MNNVRNTEKSGTESYVELFRDWEKIRVERYIRVVMMNLKCWHEDFGLKFLVNLHSHKFLSSESYNQCCFLSQK